MAEQDKLKTADLSNSSENRENNSQTEENTDTNALYSVESTLQTKDEFDKGKNGNHLADDNIVTSSGVNDLQSNSDGAAGTDRAGTAKREKYGDTELNKGLEAQAKDEES